jgi:two-component system, chemotaxis family, sensor kinase CheA
MSDEMDEIWALFVDDGAQAMDAMETALLALEKATGEEQAPHISALFRAVHTFKGNSRVLGLGVVESRAHLAEDLIGLVRDNGVPLDAEIHALLLETGDKLRDMLETTGTTRGDADPADTEDLVQRLRNKIARCTAPVDAELPDEDAVDTVQPVGEVDPEPDAQETAPQDTALTSESLDDSPAEENEAVVAVDEPAPVAHKKASRLADDPVYRKIFDDMAADALVKLNQANLIEDAAETESVVSRVIRDLDHAATQLGLDEWSAMLRGFAEMPNPVDAATLIDAIAKQSQTDALAQADLPAAATDPGGFFSQLREPLSIIARIGISLSTGEQIDTGAKEKAIAQICQAAEGFGYVRVSHAADMLLSPQTAAAYRRQELNLYEELASVEAVLGQDSDEDGMSPASLLASWCADHVFDTLDELDQTLERMRLGKLEGGGQRELERLVRLVHHACRHYDLVTASQLAMSLLDLFGRGHAHGKGPDAILMRIARGFIDTLELVFDALRVGEAPDTDRLEQLFKEASEVGFTGAGVLTATAIERKLGLPAEFHRVLSPESTRAAAEAISAGRQFYILRADVNDDNELAEALFVFIGSGAIQAITNVTVFQGQNTLFDFLIATALDEMALAEAMANMDPGGKRLVILRHLSLSAEEQGTTSDNAADAAEPNLDSIAGLELSTGILEKIGEIAAGQAMVHGILSELVEDDLAQSVDSVLRLHGHDPQQARAALKGLADTVMDRLRNMAQIETQLLGHMAELQQTTADLRARPVETVLRPLVAMVATQSRRIGKEARLTTVGAEMTLDIAVLESLKRLLRPLVMSRLSLGDAAPRRLHLSVNRSDDQLSVTLDDDGREPLSADDSAKLKAELSRVGGGLRHVRLPDLGQRYHISLPMNLVVLEGMVVGAGGTRYVLPVDSIRTILQPDPKALFTLAIDGGQRMLRLSEDEVISIRTLPKATVDRDDLTLEHATTYDDLPATGGMNKVHIILGRVGQSVAIPVDDLVGQQLVLLRPLKGVMAKLKNISGVALLSGGDVGMVLSPRAFCAGSDDMPEATLLVG